MVFPLMGQENADATGKAIVSNAEDKNGFFTTFVRTPFVLFCFVGTILGVIFAAFFEFIYNIFCGFDCGYPNTSIIWELGWKQIFHQWYWTPGVWWHVVISFIVWSPLLRKGKKSKK